MEMEKFTLTIENTNNYEEEQFDNLEAAMYIARKVLQEDTGNKQIIVYSDEYRLNDDKEYEIIDNTYEEYLNISLKEYKRLSYEEKELIWK